MIAEKHEIDSFSNLLLIPGADRNVRTQDSRPGKAHHLFVHILVLVLEYEVINVLSDNDASEEDILGHFETLWDNSEDCMMSLEHLYP